MRIFTTIIIFLIVNNCYSQNNYCIPVPPNGVNGHSINHVKLESLDTAFAGNTYQYFDDSLHHETCYLTPGTTYKIYMTSGTHNTSTLAAWIDWNNDGTFNGSEKLGEFVTTTPNQVNYISFTVPGNTNYGKLWLRVRSSNSTSITACNAYSSGETIDFRITVLNPHYEYNFFANWEYSAVGNTYIDGININGIDNQNTGRPNGPIYSDYSYLNTFITECDASNLSITGEFASLNDAVYAYIDYNNDGLFEANELLGSISVPAGYYTVSIFFTPPAIVGDFRLRVIYYSNSIIQEIEDYSISILNSISSSTPTAIIGSDLYNNCDNFNCYFYGCKGQAKFYDYSCGIPTYRHWSIPGASPSSSTSQNPIFNFPNSGIYNITLIDSNSFGLDSTTAQVFISAPVANINLGSNTTVCTGDSLLLSAPTGGPNDCYSYLWSTGATTNQIYVKQSGTYSVSLNSCHHTDCPSYDTITVTFSPLKYNVTGGGSYCAGGTPPNIGLSDSQTGITYQLYNNGVLVGTPVNGTGNAISFGIQSAAGVYTVVATNNSLSCTLTMSGNAHVNVALVPASYNVTGGGSACVGGTGVPIGVDHSELNVSYQLFRNGNSTGAPLQGTGNALQFPNHSNAGNYTVVATTNGSSCSTSMADTAVIVTIPGPVVFNVTGGGNYCGGSVASSVSLSDSYHGITYELYLDGSPTGIVLSGTDTSLKFTNLYNSGHYTIVASDSSTCKSTMNGSATLSLIPAPTKFALIGAGSVCTGELIDSIKLSGSEVWIRYQLYLDNHPVGNSLNGNGNLLNFGLHTTQGTYTVIGSNTITACVDTMAGSPIVLVSPFPHVYNVTGGGHFCNGGIGIDVGLNNSDSTVLYHLYHNNSPIDSLHGNGGVLSFGLQNAAGNYTVIATANASTCSTTMNGIATLVIDQTPTPNIVTVLPDTACIFQSPIGLVGSPMGGLFSGDGVVNDTLFPALAGIETVYVYYDYTDPSSGCSAYVTDSVFVDICNSINENDFPGTISMYPNPADNEITSYFSFKNELDLSIELINSIGEVVRYFNLKNATGSFSYPINTSQLSNGFYLIKYKMDDKLFSKILIIHH